MGGQQLTPYGVDAVALSGQLLDAVMDVYLDARRSRDDRAQRRALFVRHTFEPGWHAVAVGEPPVGFAYGFHCVPGQWWHDALDRGLRHDIGRHLANEWLADAFCLAELHVRPAWQRRGIGRALASGLLGPRGERTVVLSTPADAEARVFYARIGFTELVTHFRFPGTVQPYTVLGSTVQPGHEGLRLG